MKEKSTKRSFTDIVVFNNDFLKLWKKKTFSFTSRAAFIVVVNFPFWSETKKSLAWRCFRLCRELPFSDALSSYPVDIRNVCQWIIVWKGDELQSLIFIIQSSLDRYVTPNPTWNASHFGGIFVLWKFLQEQTMERSSERFIFRLKLFISEEQFFKNKRNWSE